MAKLTRAEELSRMQQAVDAVAEAGSIRAAAKALGWSYGMTQGWYSDAARKGMAKPRPGSGAAKAAVKPDVVEPEVKGQVKATAAEERALPAKGKVKRYLLTCAQNNTHLFEAAWETLSTVAEHYDAEIMVSRFTYDKLAQKRAVKPGTTSAADGDDVWYDPRLASFAVDRRVRLAPGLVWCGELNILPTAVRPISGLEAYTGRSSSIIPHVKIAMESIASGKFEGTKLIYTTGAVTQRNYIQRKAGQKAEFHHSYGALLVEVNSDGEWWCRQLNADSEGVIHDLDLRFDGLRVSGDTRIEAIHWGDIHTGQMDRENYKAAWGDGGIFETLKPKHQFLHDVLDFRARNHHERGNPHKAFERHVTRTGNVLSEVAQVGRFLDKVWRPWCLSVVVDSNHDNAMERWLREGDYRTDPENAVFFLEAQLARYKAIEARDKRFHLVEWAMRKLGEVETTFLRQDESFIICPDANGGIECGMHGHLGPNGRRGSAIAFARMGRKAVVGHTHSAGIVDGIYTAGTSSNLDLGYNVGPSSWSHSHVITYPNGKRAIVTVWRGKWRA